MSREIKRYSQNGVYDPAYAHRFTEVKRQALLGKPKRIDDHMANIIEVLLHPYHRIHIVKLLL